MSTRAQPVEVCGVVLNSAWGTIDFGGRRAHLRRPCCRLLELLGERVGAPMPAAEIAGMIWQTPVGERSPKADPLLRRTVHSLRGALRKIEAPLEVVCLLKSGYALRRRELGALEAPAPAERPGEAGSA